MTSFFGKQQKNYVPITPEILSNYDVIISIGKTIQYSLGLGIPSYEYDHFGGNGYISVDNIDEEAQNIFSGLPQRRKLSSKQIAHELLSEYPHIYLQVKDLKSISIERFLLSKNIKKLLQIIDDLPNFNGIQENHNLAIAHGTCCAAWLTHYKNLSYETERKYHVDYYIKHLLRIIKYSIKTAWQRSPSWLRKLVITALSWRISPHDPQAPEQPLYVLGAFASSSGLAEGARLYAQARRREGKEVICLDITHAMQQRADFPQGLEDVMAFDERQQLTRPGTVVIHANPPQFQLALLRLARIFCITNASSATGHGKSRPCRRYGFKRCAFWMASKFPAGSYKMLSSVILPVLYGWYHMRSSPPRSARPPLWKMASCAACTASMSAQV